MGQRPGAARRAHAFRRVSGRESLRVGELVQPADGSEMARLRRPGEAADLEGRQCCRMIASVTSARREIPCAASQSAYSRRSRAYASRVALSRPRSTRRCAR